MVKMALETDELEDAPEIPKAMYSRDLQHLYDDDRNLILKNLKRLADALQVYTEHEILKHVNVDEMYISKVQVRDSCTTYSIAIQYCIINSNSYYSSCNGYNVD